MDENKDVNKDEKKDKSNNINKNNIFNEKLKLKNFDSLVENRKNVTSKLEEEIKEDDYFFNLSYKDIILMKLCYCSQTYSSLRKKFEKYSQFLYDRTDYSEVLKQIISYKEFNEL